MLPSFPAEPQTASLRHGGFAPSVRWDKPVCTVFLRGLQIRLKIQGLTSRPYA